MPSNPETWADEELVRDWIRESTLVSQDLWAAYAEWEHLMELLKNLKKQGVACIYISHKLKEVLNLCDEITVLRDGNFITKI